MLNHCFQVSLEMTCTDLVTSLSECTDVVFPIFWADESAELDDYNFELYLHDVERPYNIVLGCCIAMGFIMGAAIVALGIWVCWKA